MPVIFLQFEELLSCPDPVCYGLKPGNCREGVIPDRKMNCPHRDNSFPGWETGLPDRERILPNWEKEFPDWELLFPDREKAVANLENLFPCLKNEAFCRDGECDGGVK